MEPAAEQDDAFPWTDYGVFRPGSATIRPELMLRIHGYRDLDKVRPVIKETAKIVARRAEEILCPEVHCKRMPIRECRGDELVLGERLRFRNAAFAKYLAGASDVVVIALTVGKALDEEVARVMEDFDPLRALFLETAGWLGVEWTTRQFSARLHETAHARGFRVSHRMGPGYSYKIDGRETSWRLEEQKQLFEVFSGVDLPITLLESCAMMPKMSRSGLYGLAPLEPAEN